MFEWFIKLEGEWAVEWGRHTTTHVNNNLGTPDRTLDAKLTWRKPGEKKRKPESETINNSEARQDRANTVSPYLPTHIFFFFSMRYHLLLLILIISFIFTLLIILRVSSPIHSLSSLMLMVVTQI